jgi:hypothetical protein
MQRFPNPQQRHWQAMQSGREGEMAASHDSQANVLFSSYGQGASRWEKEGNKA